MYKNGEQFTTNYDDAKWTIIGTQWVLENEKSDLKPGYLVNSTISTENFAVSHDTIEAGIHLNKLVKV